MLWLFPSMLAVPLARVALVARTPPLLALAALAAVLLHSRDVIFANERSELEARPDHAGG